MVEKKALGTALAHIDFTNNTFGVQKRASTGLIFCSDLAFPDKYFIGHGTLALTVIAVLAPFMEHCVHLLTYFFFLLGYICVSLINVTICYGTSVLVMLTSHEQK